MCFICGCVKFIGQMIVDCIKSELIDLDFYQINNYDKYDQIYFGVVDVSLGSFCFCVIMIFFVGQFLDEMMFVVQCISFILINSIGGLNGLYEYMFGRVVNVSDFMSFVFNCLGVSFRIGFVVNVFVMLGDIIYIVGNFSVGNV